MTLSAERPLFGLVLAGGHSRRMQRDKAALAYAGQPQLTRAMTQLASLTEQCFVSVRPDQVNDPLRAQWPQIIDRENESGPLAGIRAAQAYAPHAAWWVLACDLPRLERAALEHLLIKRDPNRLATCYLSAHDGLPEPLCTLYEPASAAALERYAQNGGRCPRKFLLTHPVCTLEPFSPEALDNINSADEYWQAMQDSRLHHSPARRLTLKYFAVLREQAGRSSETVETQTSSAAALYAELRAKYDFTLPQEMLKVAINGEFTDWSTPLADGDEVVFIPPVAGG